MPNIIPLTQESINAFIAEATASRSKGVSQWNDYVLSVKFECDWSLPQDVDSKEFLDRQIDIWKMISGKSDYQPHLHETNSTLRDVVNIDQTYPFVYKNPVDIANYFTAVASIIRKLDMTPPAQILEYGVGWGHSTRFLANCGFDVTAVDIEKEFLRMIPLFSAKGAKPVRLVCASFVEAMLERTSYDAVIFFECFHHCLEFRKLIFQLSEILKPGGKIVFCAEPFYEDYFDYPWGVRLDGHAVWAIHNCGWMELGFRKTYMEKLLHAHGFSTQWSTVEGIGAYGEFLVATLNS